MHPNYPNKSTSGHSDEFVDSYRNTMYYNLLPKIKNAGLAGKKSIVVPFSNMDFEVARVLADFHYLQNTVKKTIGKKGFLEIKLHYRHKEPALSEFKLISKPSRHIYAGWRDIKSVKQGHGLSVFSTPKGIMSGSQARKEKIGGEYLFQIL